MNKSIKSSITPRTELGRFVPYKAGLSIQAIKRQFGLRKVIKLASNENSKGPSARALSAYKQAAKQIFRYPESKSIDLRRQISQFFRLDVNEIIVGAGSDEVIDMIAKAYLTPQDEIVISASSFAQYRLAAEVMGAKVIEVPMKNMTHDLLSMAAATTGRTKFVFIANPNNPTGTYNTYSEVEKFLAALPEWVMPVFDEAYFEYASTKPDYPSMMKDFFRKRPMVVLRTFSKVHGLAGLRVGYGLAPEGFIEELEKVRPPFNVSVPAQAAAQVAFCDVSHVERSVARNEKEKKKLADELSSMGYAVVPSVANFLLFKVSPWKGRVLFEELLQKGIIVRTVDEYDLPDYLRVTVGNKTENKQFLRALREVANKK